MLKDVKGFLSRQHDEQDGIVSYFEDLCFLIVALILAGPGMLLIMLITIVRIAGYDK